MTLPLVAALPWLLPFLALPRLATRRPALHATAPVPNDHPMVSIIVPARNEEGTLPGLLPSLLASRWPDFEVLVVDDQSTDGTSAIVAEHAVRDPRVRLISGAPLPSGWFGKPWACVQGFREARGDLICFTDADTVHEPALLAAAVAALREEGGGTGALSIITEQVCLTFWERVVMPQVWLLLGIRYHPLRVNRATTGRDTIANGQYILLTREAYVKAGTHEAVRGAVAEDLALAQRLLETGHPVRMRFSSGLIRTRMYRSLAELVEGWSKNLYLGGRQSFPHQPLLRFLVPVTLLAGFLFWLMPPIALLVGGGAWAWIATGASVVFWVLVSAGMGIPVPYGAGYPAGAAMAAWIALRSIIRGGRRVQWRNRTYGPDGSHPTGA